MLQCWYADVDSLIRLRSVCSGTHTKDRYVTVDGNVFKDYVKQVKLDHVARTCSYFQCFKRDLRKIHVNRFQIDPHTRLPRSRPP